MIARGIVPKFHLSSKGAFVLFLLVGIVAFAQAVWWIVFMAGLVDEKVEVAEQLGADPQFVQQLHDQEISRQVMVGMEGIFFLLLIMGGAWLIYRSLVRTEELKFNQQNFLMAVTHELKTPLASIKLYLTTLNSQKIPEEKKARVLPRMKEDLERLEKLVDNILEAGRFERAGYKLHRQTIDLTDLVAQLVEKVKRIPTAKPVDVRTELASEVTVEADPAALGRAIEAVLENGLKYNNKDRVIIDISLTNDAGTARLEIADNGVGLEKNDLRAVFDRFYRVGSELSRQHPGSGLGLYLCREIVRAHGGDIVAASEGPGSGSRFVITLEAKSAS